MFAVDLPDVVGRWHRAGFAVLPGFLTEEAMLPARGELDVLHRR
ncbi:MAG TPA: hypothetical protein VF942_19045 [Acidimicrobiales bacterium]